MKKITYCLMAIMALTFGAVVCNASETLALAVAEKPAKEYKTVVYDVHLHCENCVKKVNENIAFEKGVKDLKVSLEDQTVTVTFDTSKTDEKKIQEAIQKLGYKATLRK